jgi:hypothetical protein
MKRITSAKKTTGIFSLKANALAAAVALMTFSTNVGAFSDGPALTQRIVILGKEIKEYQAQLSQLKQQYDNLQKNLIPSFNMNFNLIQSNDSLKERADDEGMNIACPGAGSLSFSALARAMSINPKGDIKEQQKEICQRIVLAQNAQYNESVKILKGVREREKELQKINQERAAIKDEPGKLQDNTNKLNAVLNKSTIEMQYSTAVIEAYDSYIQSLQQNQAMLGKQALTGDSGNETFASAVVDKFVQGAVLKVALEGAKTRER